MPSARANGLMLHYDTFGDRSGQPLVLIMGLGAQMLLWREGFCAALAERGMFVIRFDNRDVGLSEHLDHMRCPPIKKAIAKSLFRLPVGAPYDLSDMAADVVGLLDALELPKAHICGASMGCMIAQTMAVEHPHRCASLISIMSNTGEVRHRLGKPRAMLALLKKVPADRAAVAQNMVDFSYASKGPGYPVDEAEARRLGGELFDRAFHPAGFKRHLLAIFDSPSRTRALRSLRVHTQVIHGTHDPVLRPAGGALTARSVPGAELVWVKGMGHRLPEGAWDLVADAVGRHVAGHPVTEMELTRAKS